METTTQQHPKFARWALMIGIVVILNVFFSVVLALAFPAPKYEEKKTLRITAMPIMSAQRTNFGCCCVVVSIDAHYTTHENRSPCARRRDKVNQNSTQIRNGLGS